MEVGLEHVLCSKKGAVESDAVGITPRVHEAWAHGRTLRWVTVQVCACMLREVGGQITGCESFCIVQRGEGVGGVQSDTQTTVRRSLLPQDMARCCRGEGVGTFPNTKCTSLALWVCTSVLEEREGTSS